MEFKDKIEIMIRRKGYSKTDFATKLGITYRALANYISGARMPKNEVMSKMEKELDTTREFLLDKSKSLILSSEERFIFNSSPKSTGIWDAVELMNNAKTIFKGETLCEKDKQALFSCIAEIYFDGKSKAKV